jgi:hypothetical protein
MFFFCHINERKPLLNKTAKGQEIEKGKRMGGLFLEIIILFSFQPSIPLPPIEKFTEMSISPLSLVLGSRLNLD